MYKPVLLLLVALWGNAEGLNWVEGSCPPNVKGDAGLGPLLNKTLYERKSHDDYIFPADGRCGTVSVNADIPDNMLIVLVKQVSLDGTNQQNFGTAKIYGDSLFEQSGIRLFSFQEIGGQANVLIPFENLATDKMNYAVWYSCLDGPPGTKLEMAHAYTLIPGDTRFDDVIAAKLAEVGLDYTTMKDADQNNCTY